MSHGELISRFCSLSGTSSCLDVAVVTRISNQTQYVHLILNQSLMLYNSQFNDSFVIRYFENKEELDAFYNHTENTLGLGLVFNNIVAVEAIKLLPYVEYEIWVV